METKSTTIDLAKYILPEELFRYFTLCQVEESTDDLRMPYFFILLFVFLFQVALNSVCQKTHFFQKNWSNFSFGVINFGDMFCRKTKYFSLIRQYSDL